MTPLQRKNLMKTAALIQILIHDGLSTDDIIAAASLAMTRRGEDPSATSMQRWREIVNALRTKERLV